MSQDLQGPGHGGPLVSNVCQRFRGYLGQDLLVVHQIVLDRHSAIGVMVQTSISIFHLSFNINMML